MVSNTAHGLRFPERKRNGCCIDGTLPAETSLPTWRARPNTTYYYHAYASNAAGGTVMERSRALPPNPDTNDQYNGIDSLWQCLYQYHRRTEHVYDQRIIRQQYQRNCWTNIKL